jgi:hypothetical protein
MNADQELHLAIQERIAKENAFFNLLKKAIKDAVDRFDLCDTSTSPEVEESVNLSRDGLTKAIRKLKEETVLNKETSRVITDWFNGLAQDHLVQNSTHETIPQWFTPVARPAPAPTVAPATPIVTGAPAPRSFVDRLKGMVGLRPSNPAPRQDQRWIGNASYPVGPIYQAEPYDERDSQSFDAKRTNAFGGKRTRKYRRRV